MTRAESLDQIVSATMALGDDELRILAMMSKRLTMGQMQYGELNIAKDPRDWRKEASEEALDLSVYLAIALLKRA